MEDSSVNSLHKVVVGHGVDVVDVIDFGRLLTASARTFLNRHFTNSEIVDAGDGATQAEKLAGRFAVKEAVLKALGVGWGDGIAFTDVEVITLTSGAPTVLLHRRLAELQKERQIVGWMVSTSHTSAIALASVLALGESMPMPMPMPMNNCMTPNAR